MGGERGSSGMGAGKTFSSEKFNFSLRHPREWGAGVAGAAGNGCECVVCCVCACARAKGIHF